MSEREQAGAASGSPAPPRATPYELVFEVDRYEAQVFPRILADGERTGTELLLRERFSLLSTAGEAVREVIPELAPPEAFDQYRSLLFHAFNFWRFGKRVYLADTAVVRYLVEANPRMRGWELVLPYPSLYVQLPPRLFWASVSGDGPPEPVDGFFVTGVEQSDPFDRPFLRLEVLLVLGVRRDRAGFSVIGFDTEVGPGIAATWSEATGRDAGSDFENVLPGGELAGLYSLLTANEVLKLLGRVLWYVDSFPEDVRPESPADRLVREPGEPPPTRLSYHRISLGDGRADDAV